RNCSTSVCCLQAARRQPGPPLTERPRPRPDVIAVVAPLRGSRRFLAAISRLRRNECAVLSRADNDFFLDHLFLFRGHSGAPSGALEPAGDSTPRLPPNEL